jgi:3-isopropylmalate/(R)-2-methylmalate dehydratase small subunit
MQAFTILTSPVIPLPSNNVDTDQIIPAHYLKVTDKTGLAEGLFAGWRYAADGSPDPVFPLNQPVYQGCQILLAGDNFGCGSSREHAPWALLGWGLRAVISTSFADIFRNNALKNGLLPVCVGERFLSELFAASAADPMAPVTIDLVSQTVSLADGRAERFPIEPFSRLCLLEGLDQLGYILKFEPQIAAHESAHPGGWAFERVDCP